MLTHITNKLEALRRFSFETEVVAIVEDNKDKLAVLQAQQLSQGVNSKGQQINPQYAPFTVAYKKQFGVGLGAITDRVTFYQTGDLYKRLYAAVDAKTYRMKADTFKFDKMIKRSGKDVVGLNSDSRRDFIMEVTRPQILEVYHQKVTNV
jgi:hypothetical protein